MLAKMKEEGEIGAGNPSIVGGRTQLANLGIERHLSSRAQRIAAVPDGLTRPSPEKSGASVLASVSGPW